MNCVFVSFWWGRNAIVPHTNSTYQQMAKRWERNCKLHELKYEVNEISENENKNYQLGINTKPQYILYQLLKHKKPIVYTDIDMVIHKYPKIFKNLYNYDMFAFNWNADKKCAHQIDPITFETTSCIIAFNYTPQAIQTLREWIKALQTKYKHFADDRVFALIFNNKKLIYPNKIVWLPIEYACYEQFYKIRNKMITHPGNITEEREARALGARDNRIPIDYNIRKYVKHRTNDSLVGVLIPHNNKCVRSSKIIQSHFHNIPMHWKNEYCTICCNMKDKVSHATYDIVYKNDLTFIMRPTLVNIHMMKNKYKTLSDALHEFKYLLSLRILKLP